MKKSIKFLALMLAVIICLSMFACNGTSSGAKSNTHKHIDKNGDLICDTCKENLGESECYEHTDADNDSLCDKCGIKLETSVCVEHIDANNDYICDICSEKLEEPQCTDHIDYDGDWYCDKCGAKLEDPNTPILIGNTVSQIGVMASLGIPFNYGLQAALEVYNQNGGFNGREVKLKNYDDGGMATNALMLTEKLIYEDEVFAIVGSLGSYAVDGTLDMLISEEVPLIYPVSSSQSLYNEFADTIGERGIFPVQPLCETEGRMLILRAFAPVNLGGLGASKVGVIYNSNETSKGLYLGISNELKNLPSKYRNNVVTQEVYSSDYTSALYALKQAGCDVVILTVVGTDFTNAILTIDNINYYGCKVFTTYNNSAALFNNGYLSDQFVNVFNKISIYTQAWADFSSNDYIYNADTALFRTYKMQDSKLYGEGVVGFTEEYWQVAEAIFDYAYTVDKDTAWAMSYNAYAIVGYMAGNLFCQALEELEKSGRELTRENLIEILESKEFQLAGKITINYADGIRTGVQNFQLVNIYDEYNTGNVNYHIASSKVVYDFTSIEYYREIIK